MSVYCKTPVLTQRGTLPADEVRKGDKVISMGDWATRVVSEVCRIDKKLIKVYLKGYARPLIISPDQKWHSFKDSCASVYIEGVVPGCILRGGDSYNFLSTKKNFKLKFEKNIYEFDHSLSEAFGMLYAISLKYNTDNDDKGYIEERLNTFFPNFFQKEITDSGRKFLDICLAGLLGPDAICKSNTKSKTGFIRGLSRFLLSRIDLDQCLIQLDCQRLDERMIDFIQLSLLENGILSKFDKDIFISGDSSLNKYHNRIGSINEDTNLRLGSIYMPGQHVNGGMEFMKGYLINQLSKKPLESIPFALDFVRVLESPYISDRVIRSIYIRVADYINNFRFLKVGDLPLVEVERIEETKETQAVDIVLEYSHDFIVNGLVLVNRE